MNAEDYCKLGDKCFDEKNFDGAITNYTEAIKLESDNPIYYSNRGHAYIQKNDIDSAIANYNNAIRLEPNQFGIFYLYRGTAYILKGNKDRAISDIKKAVKIDPQNENYHEALKEAKEIRRGRMKTAIFMAIGLVVLGVGGSLYFVYGLYEKWYIGFSIGAFFGLGIRTIVPAIINEFKLFFMKMYEIRNLNAVFIIFLFIVFIYWYTLKLLGKCLMSPFVAIYQLITDK